MTFSDILLWPGTAICSRLGIDPKSDAGLLRWMINTLVYLVLGLIILWISVI